MDRGAIPASARAAGSDDGEQPPRLRARGRRPCAALVVTLALAVLVAGVVACGFGTDGDTGRAVPGVWWPWVCAEGDGGPVPDGGCPLPCDGGGCAVDGGTDAGGA